MVQRWMQGDKMHLVNIGIASNNEWKNLMQMSLPLQDSNNPVACDSPGKYSRGTIWSSCTWASRVAPCVRSRRPSARSVRLDDKGSYYKGDKCRFALNYIGWTKYGQSGREIQSRY